MSETPIPIQPDFETLTLPVSGLVVRLTAKRFKVSDWDRVDAMVGKKRSLGKVSAARMSLVTSKADGSFFTMEEILDWDEDDLNFLAERREDSDFLKAGARTPSS